MSSTSTISYASNNVITHNAGIITSAIPNQSNYNSASENSLAPVAYSFSLSLFLLLIVSYQKYHMDKVNNSNDYCLFFLELPIDLGNVILSIFVAYYFLVENVNAIFLAVFIEMFAMVISMTLRNSAIELLKADTFLKKDIFLRIFGELFLILFSAVFSYILFL